MTTPAPLPHPGVRVPPPLIYVLGILAGWLLDRRWPFPITGSPSPVRAVIAALCLALWLALMGGAFVAFRRARTSIIPNRPATAFVIEGPYRFTRNPMYLGLAALYFGVTLFLDSWWPAILLPVVLLIVDRQVIRREERYLSGAFPAEYPEYCRRVRRWV